MCSLGVDHVHGVDVARDVKRGLDLLYQAAELGNIQAYGKLGDMYNPELNNDYDNYNEGGKDLVTAIQYYELAAKGGHLAVLKYAHEHGCPWNWQTCANAAENGHLEVVKYAHENGCPWDWETQVWAARNGYVPKNDCGR